MVRFTRRQTDLVGPSGSPTSQHAARLGVEFRRTASMERSSPGYRWGRGGPPDRAVFRDGPVRGDLARRNPVRGPGGPGSAIDFGGPFPQRRALPSPAVGGGRLARQRGPADRGGRRRSERRGPADLPVGCRRLRLSGPIRCHQRTRLRGRGLGSPDLALRPGQRGRRGIAGNRGPAGPSRLPQALGMVLGRQPGLGRRCRSRGRSRQPVSRPNGPPLANPGRVPVESGRLRDGTVRCRTASPADPRGRGRTPRVGAERRCGPGNQAHSQVRRGLPQPWLRRGAGPSPLATRRKRSRSIGPRQRTGRV